MTRQELLAMMRAHRYAIQTSVSSTSSPQAAVVGVVVTDDFELFFYTLDTTRKMRNLRQNPKIAFVIGVQLRVTSARFSMRGSRTNRRAQNSRV